MFMEPSINRKLIRQLEYCLSYLIDYLLEQYEVKMIEDQMNNE